MKLLRMDNVSVIVKDLPAAIAFFQALGLVLEGQMPVEEAWAGRVCGIPGMKVDIAMLRMPDGRGGVELSAFREPQAISPSPAKAPVNTLGLRRLMFAVEGIDKVVEKLKAHGAELVGGIENYEDLYKLCYLRGPEGILIALAEELKRG